MNDLGYWIILIIEMVVITILIIMAVKSFRKSKSIFEKSLFIIFLIVAVCILLLYWFDTFNIPTIFGINKNLDSQNWLNVMTTFASVIISELLAGLFLIFVTGFQIQENRKDMLEKEKEERRIGNMPLLVYRFLDTNIPAYEQGNVYQLDTDDKYKKDITINISVKNVGMNALRKCYMGLDGDTLIQRCICELGEQSLLDRNESRELTFLLKLDVGIYKFRITTYYEDLLHNWYGQVVNVELEISKTGNSINGYKNIQFNVCDEEIIDKPKLKINVNKSK